MDEYQYKTLVFSVLSRLIDTGTYDRYEHPIDKLDIDKLVEDTSKIVKNLID